MCVYIGVLGREDWCLRMCARMCRCVVCETGEMMCRCCVEVPVDVLS